MYKKFLFLVVGFVFVFVLARPTSAAYLILTRIGTLSTSGLSYATWSITGESPDFSGTATPGATVAITVNAVTATTSTALSGVWLYKPLNIVGGTNSVSIASGNEVISFLLNYTPVASPTAQVTPIATSGALPEAGGTVWPVVLIGSGFLVFILGKAYRDRVDEEWNI